MSGRLFVIICLASVGGAASGCISTELGLTYTSEDFARLYRPAPNFDSTRKTFVGTRLALAVAGRSENWRAPYVLSVGFWDIVFLPFSVVADFLILPFTQIHDSQLPAGNEEKLPPPVAAGSGDSGPSTQGNPMRYDGRQDQVEQGPPFLDSPARVGIGR